MNAPLNTGLQQIIEQINACTQEIRKCNEWYAARDAYIRDAVSGHDYDWTSFDEAANAVALTTIQAALALPAEQCKSAVQRAIAGLIQHCATGHANVMQRGGAFDPDPYVVPAHQRSQHSVVVKGGAQ